MFDIREDDLSGAATQALIALHLQGMHAASPPGTVFALDLSGLKVPALTLYRNRGFIKGDSFADYRPSPFNQFLHLEL